jgi:hypothetical protein
VKFFALGLALQISFFSSLIASDCDHNLNSLKTTILGLDGLDPNDPNISTLRRAARLTCIGELGLDTLLSCMQAVQNEGVPGDFLEAGVWKGGVTIFMKAFLNAVGDENRKVYVADSFQGWPEVVNDPDAAVCNNISLPWIVVSKSEVEDNFRRFDLLDDRVEFIEGFFHESLKNAPVEKLAILRLDSDLYESTKISLEELYPKLSVGGYVIIDDYGLFASCDRAVHEFRKEQGITDTMLEQYPGGGPGVYWKKTHD